MTAQDNKNNQIIPLNIDTISFDSFERNPLSNIVCVAPIRTIVRREEEIVLIRRVRKVEEIDASPACPVNTLPLFVIGGELKVYADEERNLPSLKNESNTPVVIEITVDGSWNYGKAQPDVPTANKQVTADGNEELGRRESMLYKNINAAALVTVKDGKPLRWGVNQQPITLLPGEAIAFINNDEPGCYGDNGHEHLTVKWSVKSAENIDASSIKIKPETLVTNIREWKQRWDELI